MPVSVVVAPKSVAQVFNGCSNSEPVVLCATVGNCHGVNSAVRGEPKTETALCTVEKFCRYCL